MAGETNWLEFLYAALGSAYGVVIAVSDADAAKQALYRARAKSGDPDLNRLQLRTSPTDPIEHIWIVKDAEAER
jgi:hypothetical protein